MQPIALLCEIAAQGKKVATLAYAENPTFSSLWDGGWLENDGVVQSIACTNCNAAHDAEIVYNGEQNGVFCPDTGFVPIETNEICAVRANTPKLVEALANTFECRARKSSPIAGATWRVGRATTETGDIGIYFHPALQTENHVTDVSAALAREPGSTYRLLLSATGNLQVPGMKTVPLTEVIELDTSGAGFRSIADLRDLVGALRKNPGGAPNLYGETLSALIKQRIADGRALVGRNEEAKAILTDFKHTNPHVKPPSLSSVEDYVTKVRAGQ